MGVARTAYVNGAWVAIEEARVSVLDRGFLFADGIYEVTTVIDGRLVDLDRHLDRLERSAAELGLALAEPRGRIADIHAEIVARNGLQEGVVYLQATRGAADRDFLPAPGTEPTLVLFTQARTIVDTPAARNGIAVATMADIRWARRDIKSVALLAQVLAKREAAARGAQEAWMVEDGLVTEGGSSTAWILTGDGRLVTRGHSQTTLPGVTALAVSTLAEEMDLTIDRRGFSVEEAKAAREAFVTAASSLVLPVISIDGATVGDGTPGPVASRLRSLYVEFARGTRV
jgi:D-alanine transaminase